MTMPPAGARRDPPPRGLAARLFRALYFQFELRSFGGLHVTVLKGTPWYVGRSLAELACQISSVPSLNQNGDPGDQCRSRQDETS